MSYERHSQPTVKITISSKAPIAGYIVHIEYNLGLEWRGSIY